MTQPVKLYRLGLVVGKFSPLHRGHEHVINQALNTCDRVLVVGYSQPPFPGCELEQRKAWVDRRFPQVINCQVDDAWVQQRCAEMGIAWQPVPLNDAPDEEQQAWLAWLLDEPLQMRPDAMFGSETYVIPTTKLLGQQWGRSVEPVVVDLERKANPISATQVRTNVHAHREWLHPDVYRDFVHRVVLLGGESSGKTTLAQALAEEFQTAWVPEYGRERWVACGGQLTLEDLSEIARIQAEREDALLSTAHAVLFCDTSPLTTLGYAGWMFNTQPEALRELAQRPYSLTVFCESDFDFVQDGTRRNAEFQRLQQEWYEAQLASRDELVLRVRGSVSDRVAQVKKAVLTLIEAGS